MGLVFTVARGWIQLVSRTLVSIKLECTGNPSGQANNVFLQTVRLAQKYMYSIFANDLVTLMWIVINTEDRLGCNNQPDNLR